MGYIEAVHRLKRNGEEVLPVDVALIKLAALGFVVERIDHVLFIKNLNDYMILICEEEVWKNTIDNVCQKFAPLNG